MNLIDKAAKEIEALNEEGKTLEAKERAAKLLAELHRGGNVHLDR